MSFAKYIYQQTVSDVVRMMLITDALHSSSDDEREKPYLVAVVNCSKVFYGSE